MSYDFADVVDIFPGPGGWDQGLRQTGSPLNCIGIEIDRDACETAMMNGHKRRQDDVSAVDPMEYDGIKGLIASPPCQGFSRAGKGKGLEDAMLLIQAIDEVIPGHATQTVSNAITFLREYMQDSRSVLALEPLRWALDLRPEWTVWEQVPAVMPIWQASADVLRKAGYNVWVGNMNSERYGVPQTRTRAVLIASRTRKVHEPVPTHSKYYSRDPERLDDGVEKWVSMGDALGWSSSLVGFPRKDDGLGPVVMIGDQAYRARDLRSSDKPAQAVTEKARSWLRYVEFCGAGVTSRHTSGQRPRKTDEPAHTITGKGTAAWSAVLDGSHVSRVTIDQAKVLQSFPDDYLLSGLSCSKFQQIGNAIPPLLAQRILEVVL